jgi:hypothetical protein
LTATSRPSAGLGAIHSLSWYLHLVDDDEAVDMIASREAGLTTLRVRTRKHKHPVIDERAALGNASTNVCSGSLPLSRLNAMMASVIGFASTNWRSRSAVLASITREGVRERLRRTA